MRVRLGIVTIRASSVKVRRLRFRNGKVMVRSVKSYMG